jgi:dUTP pyrophosphatase
VSVVPVRLQLLDERLGKEIPLPARMSEHAAGYDVAAAVRERTQLAPGARLLIPCGFAMSVPPGFEVQVRPRSGLAVTNGIGVLNSPGTIDADYRGEVRVILVNLGDAPVTIEPGMRIAQLVVAPVVESSLEVVTMLDGTARGQGGFGSTGR